jgi:hypothetical protein
MGSVALHELYFARCGDGATVFTAQAQAKNVEPVLSALELIWQRRRLAREFVALAEALSDGSGWVVLAGPRGERRLDNRLRSPPHTR